MLVGLRLSLVAILSKLGIEGLVLTLFDLHRTREVREQGISRGLELPKADESTIKSREFVNSRGPE
jgi:hypothetical protein